jgi:hypothetical protein
MSGGELRSSGELEIAAETSRTIGAYEAEFVLQWLDEMVVDQQISEMAERGRQRRERRALIDYVRSFGCEK